MPVFVPKFSLGDQVIAAPGTFSKNDQVKNAWVVTGVSLGVNSNSNWLYTVWDIDPETGLPAWNTKSELLEHELLPFQNPNRPPKAQRGEFTDEIETEMTLFLGRSTCVRELRLYPYLVNTILNSREIERQRIDMDDQRILDKLEDGGHISVWNPRLMVTKPFWQFMNNILWLGYANFDYAHTDVGAAFEQLRIMKNDKTV